jgi:hypothetical protein
MTRSRNYCFTSFLDSVPEYDDLMMKYMCYGKEVCPKTKKRHFQGFVCFKNPVSVKIAQGLLKIDNSHMEVIKGKLSDNEKYCKKDGDWIEHGTLPIQGKRNDLRQAIADNETLVEFRNAEPDLFCRFNRGIKDIYLNKAQPVLHEEKVVYYIHGPSGVEKSRKARTECPTPFALINYSNGFLNGYEGEKHAVYDEFRDSSMPLCDFLLMTDKYSNRMNIKGGSCIFDVKILYITSIKSHLQLYQNADESREQINRRLSVINLTPKDNVLDLSSTSLDYIDPVYELNKV